MPQRLPVFRAARLVGVSRNTLQKKIRQEGIETFEGSIDLSDLLKLYPKVDLSHDSEYERVQHIKATAFAKRVRERVMPDAEILASRLEEIGHELATNKRQLSQYKTILDQILKRLSTFESNKAQKDNRQQIKALLHWIEANLTTSESTETPAQELIAHDTVLRIMSAHIKIIPSNNEFWLEGNSSILEAAVSSGLSLNYGCTNGNCGLCKARVVSGEVKKIQNHDYVLSEAEKNMNYILLCSCTAISDVVIEALEAKDENDIPHQEVATKVKKIDRLNQNVTELHLQTPRVQRLRFLAGQSVTLTFPGGLQASYPIASCPCDDRNLLFHIQHNLDNNIDIILNEKISKGDEITVNGPHGDFILNENSTRSQVYIAYGTGFAPIKSLIEHAMAIDESSSMSLYWVTEKKEDLYLNNLCRSWNDALENFHYHPTIGNDAIKTITVDSGNLENCDIYLAGTKAQTNTARERLLENDLPEKQLFIYNLN